MDAIRARAGDWGRVVALCAIILIVAASASPVGAAPTQETLPAISGSDHVVAPGSTVTVEVTADTVHSIVIEGIPASWEIVESDSGGSEGVVREMNESSNRVVGWVFPESVTNRTATVTLTVPETADTGSYRLPVRGEHLEGGEARASTIVNVDPGAADLALPIPVANGPYRVVEGKSVSTRSGVTTATPTAISNRSSGTSSANLVRSNMAITSRTSASRIEP